MVENDFIQNKYGLEVNIIIYGSFNYKISVMIILNLHKNIVLVIQYNTSIVYYGPQTLK